MIVCNLRQIRKSANSERKFFHDIFYVELESKDQNNRLETLNFRIKRRNESLNPHTTAVPLICIQTNRHVDQNAMKN